MMYVCTQTSDSIALTVGHIYEGELHFSDYGLRVRDDNGKLTVYAKDRFRVASLDDAYDTTHYLDGRVSPIMQRDEEPHPDLGKLLVKQVGGTAEQPVLEVRAKPSDRQVGGAHYKDAVIQPAVFAERNKLTHLEANVVKRVYRHSRGGKGREDIEKAIHELEFLLELHY